MEANDATCYPDLPNPQLELVESGKEYKDYTGTTYVNYQFRVANWKQFPAELFAAAPDLPPCGQNPNAARTWTATYDSESGIHLYGSCGTIEDFKGLYARVPVKKGDNPPKGVFLTLEDRKCRIIYKSNTVELVHKEQEASLISAAPAVSSRPSWRIENYPNRTEKSGVTVGSIWLTPEQFRGMCLEPFELKDMKVLWVVVRNDTDQIYRATATHYPPKKLVPGTRETENTLAPMRKAVSAPFRSMGVVAWIVSGGDAPVGFIGKVLAAPFMPFAYLGFKMYSDQEPWAKRQNLLEQLEMLQLSGDLIEPHSNHAGAVFVPITSSAAVVVEFRSIRGATVAVHQTLQFEF